MEIKSFLSGKSLPEMVFAQPFKYYCFSEFDTVFPHQLSDFLNICYAYFVKYGEQIHYVGELADNDQLLHAQEFSTKRADKEAVIEYLGSYSTEDLYGIPHFVLIAPRMFWASNAGSMVIYADRSYEVAIIGTNNEDFFEFAKGVPGEHGYLMNIDSYLTFLKRISKPTPETDAMIETFRQNYGGRVNNGDATPVL